MEAAGAQVEEVSLPHTDYGLATYYIIAPAECSSNLARYDGVKYGLADRTSGDFIADYLRTRGDGFGPEVKRRIMLGTYALSAGYYDAYYLKAQKVRTLIKADFDAVWAAGFDAICAPTSPTVAFPMGAKMDDPVAMYLSDACTLPVNMAGLPGRLDPGRPVRWAPRRPPDHRSAVERARDASSGSGLRRDNGQSTLAGPRARRAAPDRRSDHAQPGRAEGAPSERRCDRLGRTSLRTHR